MAILNLPHFFLLIFELICVLFHLTIIFFFCFSASKYHIALRSPILVCGLCIGFEFFMLVLMSHDGNVAFGTGYKCLGYELCVSIFWSWMLPLFVVRAQRLVFHYQEREGKLVDERNFLLSAIKRRPYYVVAISVLILLLVGLLCIAIEVVYYLDEYLEKERFCYFYKSYVLGIVVSFFISMVMLIVLYRLRKTHEIVKFKSETKGQLQGFALFSGLYFTLYIAATHSQAAHEVINVYFPMNVLTVCWINHQIYVLLIQPMRMKGNFRTLSVSGYSTASRSRSNSLLSDGTQNTRGSQGHGMPPTPSRSSGSDQLSTILHNSVKRRKLRSCAQRSLCAETVDFWAAIQQYRRDFTGIAELDFVTFYRIFRCFISLEAAPFPVNLPAEIYMTLHQLTKKEKYLTISTEERKEVFCNAEEEVEALMDDNLLFAFNAVADHVRNGSSAVSYGVPGGNSNRSSAFSSTMNSTSALLDVFNPLTNTNTSSQSAPVPGKNH